MGVELFVEAIALLFGGIAARWMFTQVRARAQEWMARRQLEALASEAHLVEPKRCVVIPPDHSAPGVIYDEAHFFTPEPGRQPSLPPPPPPDEIVPRTRNLTPGIDALAWFFGMFSTRPKT